MTSEHYTVFFFLNKFPPEIWKEKKRFRNNVPTHRCRKCKTSLARTSNSVQSTPSLHSQAENHHVNSDTCNQKKVLVNELTLVVADVSDGTAQAAIKSLGQVIREV